MTAAAAPVRWVFCPHAVDRARQRIAGVCPMAFLTGVCWAIDRNRRDLVEFVETNAKGRQVWRAKAAAGPAFIVVTDLIERRVITVFPDNRLNARLRQSEGEA